MSKKSPDRKLTDDDFRDTVIRYIERAKYPQDPKDVDFCSLAIAVGVLRIGDLIRDNGKQTERFARGINNSLCEIRDGIEESK